MDAIPSLVTDLPQSEEALACSLDVVESLERSDSRIEIGVGAIESTLSLGDTVLGAGPAADPRNEFADGLDHDLLDEICADRHSPRAVADRWTSVHVVPLAVLVGGADHHARTARLATQHAETC